MIDFLGRKKSVRLTQTSKQQHIIVNILTENAEPYIQHSFSSRFIDELIEKLQEANEYIKTQDPVIVDGKHYAYKFAEKITEDDYLKAKHLVNRYEKKRIIQLNHSYRHNIKT